MGSGTELGRAAVVMWWCQRVVLVLDGAGWACLAMPRWRGGSGAGAGADVVTLIVLELSGLV
jgi:hypothetical protein